jgi:hypothetical protein
MSQTSRLTANHEVLIISTSYVRGDEATLEFPLQDEQPWLDSGVVWTLEDEAQKPR